MLLSQYVGKITCKKIFYFSFFYLLGRFELAKINSCLFEGLLDLYTIFQFVLGTLYFINNKIKKRKEINKNKLLKWA